VTLSIITERISKRNQDEILISERVWVAHIVISTVEFRCSWRNTRIRQSDACHIGSKADRLLWKTLEIFEINIFQHDCSGNVTLLKAVCVLRNITLLNSVFVMSHFSRTAQVWLYSESVNFRHDLSWRVQECWKINYSVWNW